MNTSFTKKTLPFHNSTRYSTRRSPLFSSQTSRNIIAKLSSLLVTLSMMVVFTGCQWLAFMDMFKGTDVIKVQIIFHMDQEMVNRKGCFNEHHCRRLVTASNLRQEGSRLF